MIIILTQNISNAAFNLLSNENTNKLTNIWEEFILTLAYRNETEGNMRVRQEIKERKKTEEGENREGMTTNKKLLLTITNTFLFLSHC